MDYRPILLAGILAATALLALPTASPLAAEGVSAVVVKTTRTQAPGRDRLRHDALAELEQALAEMPELPTVPGYPEQLAELWQLAATEHPSIKLMLSEASALEQRVLPAGAPPDPMLMVGLMNHQPGNPFSYNMPMTNERLALRQLLERGSKRKARRTLAGQDAVVQRRRVESARYALGEKLLDRWFDLAEVSVRLKQLERNRKLLKALREVVRLRFELNQAPQADLLAVEEKIAGLDRKKADLLGMRDTLRASLASAAGLAVEQLPPLEEVRLPGLDVVKPEEWQPVLDQATSEHPDSRLYDALAQRLRDQREVLRLNYKADPTVEAAWGFNPQNPDFISLSFSIPLQLHNDEKLDPQVKENFIREEQVGLMRQELAVKIRSAVQVEAARLESLPERRRVLETLTLPLLKQTFNSQLGGYQARKVGFADLLRTTMDTIEAETALLLLDVDEARAEARLDYYTLGLLRRNNDGTTQPE